MHKFLWNGYSADKWRWDEVGAAEAEGVFQRALAAEMASEVVSEDVVSLSSRQESTRSFWLPDWKKKK